MAICKWCGQKMLKSDDCPSNLEIRYPDGITLPSSTAHFDEQDGRCHDCHVLHGNHHHPGCDVERCPRCSGQLITCGCLDDEGVDRSKQISCWYVFTDTDIHCVCGKYVQVSCGLTDEDQIITCDNCGQRYFAHLDIHMISSKQAAELMVTKASL